MRNTVVVLLALLMTGGVAGADPEKAAVKGKVLPKVDVKAIAERAAGSFQAFCQEWMQKLAARERDNKQKIKWENGAEGTRGEYVGYSQEHTCQMRDYTNPESVPVGIITYREYRYQQTGATSEEAMKNEPRAVEAIEVTEIFRYTAGKWVY